MRAIVRRELGGVGDLSTDGLGSVVCELAAPDRAPRLVLDSHMDEVGWMVQSIRADGGIAFVPLGGWWSHVLLGQRVRILTSNGVIPAVVGASPPHHLKDEDRGRVVPLEAMVFDVGAGSRDAVQQLGVQVGDVAVPETPFVEMAAPGVVSCKALDNRIGVALMIHALQAAAKRSSTDTAVIGVATAQEEVGARGAQTASELAGPDIAIVLECTPADDLPPIGDPQARLGAGPQLRYYDPTAIANRKLARWIGSVADEIGVPLQRAVRRSGGTDAGTLHRHGAGVPTAVLGVPGRYIHSHVSMMQQQDFEHTLTLLNALVDRLDAAQIAELRRFD